MNNNSIEYKIMNNEQQIENWYAAQNKRESYLLTVHETRVDDGTLCTRNPTPRGIAIALVWRAAITIDARTTAGGKAGWWSDRSIKARCT